MEIIHSGVRWVNHAWQLHYGGFFMDYPLLAESVSRALI